MPVTLEPAGRAAGKVAWVKYCVVTAPPPTGTFETMYNTRSRRTFPISGCAGGSGRVPLHMSRLRLSTEKVLVTAAPTTGGG